MRPISNQDNQEGFRQIRRSCDQSSTIRITFELFSEMQASLFNVFEDFTRSIDLIHRETMWCQAKTIPMNP